MTKQKDESVSAAMPETPAHLLCVCVCVCVCFTDHMFISAGSQALI